jgi:plasmid stabilization system protein ParE
MADLLIASAAEEDFAESLRWYAERSPQAALGVEAEFERALQSIAADPQRFPHCDHRHRYYIMRRFPFQVIYREHQNGWLVVAVAHAKRKPGYWSGR